MTKLLNAPDISKKIEFDIRTPVSAAQLIHVHVLGSTDEILKEDDSYRIDYCLSRRLHGARGCYRERWNRHRFEPIGRIFLLPPGETLQGRCDFVDQSQATLLYYLQKEALKDWFEGDLKWTNHRLAAGLNVSSTRIKNVLSRLVDEIRSPGFASDVMFELLAAQMALELIDYCTSLTNASASTGGLAAWRLKLIEERLREVPAAPTLSELAALCNISARHLARGFRVSRGQSIGDYIAQYGIENAKKLLAGSESIKAIAYALGFTAPCYFSHSFRRATGERPSEFRQRTRRTIV